MTRLSYLKGLVICHGKSEKLICDFIKSNLRIQIEIDSDKKGKKSIQITSIMKFLSGEKYKNIVWDFIGRLQKNKIKYIINNVNLIHSIDSYELLEDINKKAIENGRTVNGLIQINVSKEESKTGIYVEDFEKDSNKYFLMDNVKIIGFMTMAPLGASEEEISKYFSKMLDLKRKYAEKYDYLTELSMGMSGDYIEALKNGATIIRIGSKLISK